MATRFLHLDLSDQARDFRPIALEPGVPLLDRGGGSARILFRWLGGKVAEPVWEGDSVDFFVQDDRGGRLEEVICRPVAAEDFEKLLKDELAALKNRLQKATPETPTEETLKEAVEQSLAELLDDPQRTDLDCYFFRYRDAQGIWRLVWCWGYRRGDEETAPAVICTDPGCNLLFVRRPGQSPRCPSCAVALVARPRQRSPWKRAALLALLLLLIAGLLYWFFRPLPPIVLPDHLQMVAGEIRQLHVISPEEGPVAIISPDSRLVEVTEANRLIARGASQLDLHVTQGRRTQTIRVEVTTAEFKSIAIEPAQVVVPVDDSVGLRVMAEVAGEAPEKTVEIAPDLLSCPERPSPRFAELDTRSMRVRGIAPTDPKSPQSLSFRFGKHTGSATVDVLMPPFHLTLEPKGPLEIPLGQQRRMTGWANYEDGRRVEVPPARLKLLGPSAPGLEVYGDRIAARQSNVGPIKVHAEYFGQTSNKVSVRSVEPGDVTLQLEPDRTDHLAGETGQVIVRATDSDGDVELVPEMTAFRSGYTDLLEIDAQSGAFRTLAPGEATVTVNHPAAGESAGLTLSIGDPDEDRPVAVRIITEQDQPVRFPVGARFDDFRVEAEYADGFTRLVTNKATLRTAQSPQEAPLAASDGELVGLRAGQTTIEAEFEAVRSKQPLAVEVLGELDVDELRIEPARITMLSGETIISDVVGYKEGRNIGVISGLGAIEWQSSDPAVARAGGSSITGLALGTASITAALGEVISAPVEVHVVDTLTDTLAVDPRVIRIREGQSVRIGTELAVYRGDIDLSRQCDVRPALPEVVQYIPQTHSLLGRAPGASAVAFTFGGQLVNAMVEVLPSAGAIDGEVFLEPAAANLAVGQALDLRAYVITPDGRRIDRTDAAVFSSSAPGTVTILGNRPCAMAPGTAEIAVTLPGADKTATAYLSVSDEPITGLIVEPGQINMSTGDRRLLRILGRTATGLYELFPQPDLQLSVGGPNPETIEIVGSSEIDGLRPGHAQVVARWQDRLQAAVPVNVSDDLLVDLQLDPGAAVIHPGQPLVYQVTGLRGGRLRVLGPEDGVKLSVTDSQVAEAVDNQTVLAKTPGRTVVVARLGNQQAEAGLDVTACVAATTTGVLIDDRGWVDYYGPGAGYWGGRGHGYWVDGDRYWDGEQWMVVDDGTIGVYVPPGGEVIRVPRIWIEPAEVSLEVGKTTPRLVAVADDAEGLSVPVSATWESLDPNLLAADPQTPGQFVARAVGRTQVRASYRGAEAYADVNVSGQRFLEVIETLNGGTTDFDVTLEVLAAESEGPLEYRVYEAGQTPDENWIAAELDRAELDGQFRRVVLRSPRMAYGSPDSFYYLIIEARDPAAEAVQQYPFSFRIRIRREIERTDPRE